MNLLRETSCQRTQTTRQLQADYTHQLRRSLIVVERNLSLKKALGDSIHKEGRTSKRNACRRQVEISVLKYKPPTVYKHAATLHRGVTISSLILLEVHFYRQDYIVLRVVTYIVPSHKASYLYLVDNLLLHYAYSYHTSSKCILLYIPAY
jgi:hypothetical protein